MENIPYHLGNICHNFRSSICCIWRRPIRPAGKNASLVRGRQRKSDEPMTKIWPLTHLCLIKCLGSPFQLAQNCVRWIRKTLNDISDVSGILPLTNTTFPLQSCNYIPQARRHQYSYCNNFIYRIGCHSGFCLSVVIKHCG